MFNMPPPPAHQVPPSQKRSRQAHTSYSKNWQDQNITTQAKQVQWAIPVASVMEKPHSPRGLDAKHRSAHGTATQEQTPLSAPYTSRFTKTGPPSQNKLFQSSLLDSIPKAEPIKSPMPGLTTAHITAPNPILLVGDPPQVFLPHNPGEKTTRWRIDEGTHTPYKVTVSIQIPAKYVIRGLQSTELHFGATGAPPRPLLMPREQSTPPRQQAMFCLDPAMVLEIPLESLILSLTDSQVAGLAALQATEVNLAINPSQEQRWLEANPQPPMTLDRPPHHCLAPWQKICRAEMANKLFATVYRPAIQAARESQTQNGRTTQGMPGTSEETLHS